MSFSNDDDKDGLAALFGGITPQRATPPDGERAAEPDPEPAAPQPWAPQPAAPQQGTPSQPASPEPASQAGPEQPAPRYPGLEPAAAPPAFPLPSYQPPAYQPPAYQPPAAPPPANEPPTSQPPAYEPPVARPPAHEPPASEPPTYQAPPAEPPAYQPPAYQPPAAPPTYQPPAYRPPVSPPPAYEAPAPPATSVGYDLPAPASPPANPAEFAPPTQPPTFAPPAAGGYDVPAPSDAAPATPPPTAQYPTGMPFPAPVVPPPYFPSASDTAPDADSVPEPLQEPPAPSGVDSLGLGGRDEPPADVAPDPSPFARPSASPDSSPDQATPSRNDAAPSGVAVAPDATERPIVRVPTGALLPAPPDAPPIETAEELARPTTLEKVGLVAAILTGPIGLVLALVTAAIGARRRGWVIGLTRAAIVLGILSTIGVAIGGVALWNLRVAQLEHAEVAAASAQFCAAAAENPTIVEPPLLGWPDPGATIPESLTAMQEWTTRWTELIPVSPEALRPGLESLAARGQEIVTAVETSRLVDDEANSQLIRSTASQSGVANWHATYCVAP